MFSGLNVRSYVRILIVKYCTGMLIICEEVVIPDLSQLKIGKGPKFDKERVNDR